jgi:O-antigen/teichoic acid export membrane protein
MFIFFGNFFNMILIVGNRQKNLMKALFFVAIGNILANLLVIPRFSSIGAAGTSLVTEFVVAILTGVLSFRLLGYRPSMEKISRVFVSAVIMSGVLFLTRTLPFLLSGTISVFLYLVSLWLLKAVSSSEVAGLFSKQPEMGAVPAEDIR